MKLILNKSMYKPFRAQGGLGEYYWWYTDMYGENIGCYYEKKHIEWKIEDELKVIERRYKNPVVIFNEMNGLIYRMEHGL